MTTLKVDLSGYTEGKHPCLNTDECSSSDGMHYYSSTNTAHCFVCKCNFIDSNGEFQPKGEVKLTSNVKLLSKEDRERINAFESKGKGYRGIRDDIYQKFRFKHEYNASGELITQYVPVTTKEVLSGYKARKMPKDFFTVGDVSKNADFIGQYQFRNHTGTLLIVGGETKMAAAYQMLKDNNTSTGGKWDEVAVVSLALGESSLSKQIKSQWSFVNQFRKIVIAMDSDTAGDKAVEDAMDNFPQGKTYIMKMRYKDADDYIKVGKENEFVRDFIGAKQHVNSNITPASETYDSMKEFVSSDRYSLPPQFKDLNTMLKGGLPVAGICTLAAGSSCGKSSFVNSWLLHFRLALDLKIAVAPFEASEGEYMLDLTSTVINKKIAYLETKEERLNIVDSDNTRKAHKLISKNKEGEDALFLIDVDIDVEEMKERIIELITVYGVKIIILDPFSDLQDVLGKDETDKFMAWMKSIFKRYSVLFVLINHIRKAASGQKAASTGGSFNEEDIIGSSTIFKSSSVIILAQRDKLAEDDIVRNTTQFKCTKSRGVGSTGLCGQLYYDGLTHRMYDLDDWLNQLFLEYEQYYRTYYDYSLVELD